MLKKLLAVTAFVLMLSACDIKLLKDDPRGKQTVRFESQDLEKEVRAIDSITFKEGCITFMGIENYGEKPEKMTICGTFTITE